MTGVALITLYNRLACLVVGAGRPGIISLNEERRLQAEAVIALSEELGALPPAYLAACFAKHSWAYRPKFERLEGNAYVSFFKQNRNEAYHWYRNIAREKDSDDLRIELPRGWEIVKARYAADAQEDRCRLEVVVTGGYNASSAICGRCKLRSECASD